MSEVEARLSSPSGSAPRLWGVTWPLLCSLALSLSLHFTDSFFLAQISDQAAAAAGALFPLLGATIVVFSSVGQAGGSVASLLTGARRYDELPLTYLVLVGFNTLLGLTSSLGFIVFHEALPRWLGLSGSVAEQSSSFLLVVGGGQFLKAVQIAYSNVLSSRRQTHWAFVEAIITNFCNITFNVALLRGWFGLEQSITGIAWVTVASLAIGMCFTIAIVHIKLRVRFALGRNAGHLKERLRRVLAIGLPSALEPISYQFAQMTVNALIIPWGEVALATRTYVFNFYMVSTVLLAVAFGIGTQVMVSHAVGAEEFLTANAEMRRGLSFGVIGNFVLAGLLALFHVPLLRLLTDDPAIHQYAGPLFLLGMLVEPGRAVNIVAGGALRSTGDARYTALIGICLMWLVGIPLCFFFGRTLGLGLTGIWIAFACDEILRGVVNYRRWRSGHWKKFRISLRPAPAAH